jgi:ribosome-binding factor A
MKERRIARLEQQIKERIATALVHEIADPRMGFVTVSRVEMDRELQKCIVYWSVLDDATHKRTEQALNSAAGFLRSEVAAVLHTRTVPRLEFRHDASVAGAQRMQTLLDELRQQRGDPALPDPDDLEPPPE